MADFADGLPRVEEGKPVVHSPTVSSITSTSTACTGPNPRRNVSLPDATRTGELSTALCRASTAAASTRCFVDVTSKLALADAFVVVSAPTDRQVRAMPRHHGSHLPSISAVPPIRGARGGHLGARLLRTCSCTFFRRRSVRVPPRAPVGRLPGCTDRCRHRRGPRRCRRAAQPRTVWRARAVSASRIVLLRHGQRLQMSRGARAHRSAP